MPAASSPDFKTRVFAVLAQMGKDLRSDFSHFYRLRSLQLLALPFAVAAYLANTDRDQVILNLVHTRSIAGVSFFDAVDNFANYGIILYLLVLLVLGFQRNGWQLFRTVAVAWPAVVLFQRVLGASRPGHAGSGWNFFNSTHGISGHAYLGSIPFIILARQAEGIAKWALYAISFLPGIARVALGAHYPSQALLGWCFAYLATEMVMRTETEKATPVAQASHSSQFDNP